MPYGSIGIFFTRIIMDTIERRRRRARARLVQEYNARFIESITEDDVDRYIEEYMTNNKTYKNKASKEEKYKFGGGEE